MNYIIQIHLEHKEDIIREIKIPSSKSLEDLHYTIIKCLKLDKHEMASFYTTNDNFDLLQEIPLFKIDSNNSTMQYMSQIKIESILPKINDKLIYIYDFLKMWRFLISYSKKSKCHTNSIEIINSVGTMPKEAPNIIFEEKKYDNFNDFNNDFGQLDESEY